MIVVSKIGIVLGVLIVVLGGFEAT